MPPAADDVATDPLPAVLVLLGADDEDPVAVADVCKVVRVVLWSV